MHEAQSFFPFWIGHPNIRNRTQSSTIYDIFRMMLGPEALVSDNDEAREESRDTLGRLPRFHKVGGSEKTLRRNRTGSRAPVTPPLRKAQSECKPTPIKSGCYDSVTNQNGAVIDKVLQEYLQDKFSEHIHRDLPLVEFIYTVYKFGPDEIPEKTYTLPKDACWEFCDVEKEIDSYDSLEDLFAHLQKQLYGKTEDRVLDSQFIPLRERKPRSDYAQFRPDFFLSTVLGILWRQQSWIAGLSYGEVKRSGKMPKSKHPTHYKFNVTTLNEEFLQYKKNLRKRKSPVDSAGDGPSQKQPRHESWKSATKRASIATDTNVPTKMKRKTASSPLAEPSIKRLRSEEGRIHVTAGDDAATTTPDRRPLSADELQSGKYINELVSHGIRSYGTGWLLQDTTMTLWYADRMGVVQSAAFDIFKEPHYLLLVTAAMSSADMHDMGISPLVKMEGRKFGDYGSMKIEIDEAETDNGLVEDLQFNIVDANAMHTEYGAVGRGTTVVPVCPIGVTPELLGMDKASGEDLVIKLAWPPATRTAETVYVKTIRQSLKDTHVDMLKHVVDVKCFMERTMKEADLPRAFMNFTELDGFDERVLRCIVMKRYEPLQMVKDAEEFKIIFVDVVRAHHCIFEITGILHRDISVGNVMFYRVNGRVIGVLCDWDQAMDTHKPHNEKRMVIEKPADSEQPQTAGDQKLPGSDDVMPIRPRYRTGTGPFMAWDLLQEGEAPIHIYRFDLESFFWLLAWFCAVFDQDNHTFRGKAPWDNTSLFSIGKEKRAFLMKDVVCTSMFETAHPGCRDLIDGWVHSLRRYFQCILEDEFKMDRLDGQINDARAAGDTEEENAVRERLEAIKESRINIVTYKGFMSRLGIKDEDSLTHSRF